MIVTDNYGEAGPLELLGTGLPPVHSGHNAYGDWGPPPDSRTAAIVVTHATQADFGRWWRLGACALVERVDNGLDVENEEQGVGVWVCPNVTTPWSVDWPRLRHLN